MAGLHDFTTKEVLNKVLLDSSGNAVAAYSHTSQEALNAVLDTTNSRLNVAIVGGTISGDVTIGGDLTVTGSTAITTNEVIQGTSIIDVTNTEAFLVRKDSDGGDIFIVDTTNNQIEMYNTVGINATPTLGKLQINTSSSTRGLVINASDSNASYMQFTNSSTGTTTGDGLQIGLQTDESAFIDLKEAKNLVINTSGSQALKIWSTKQVGFGATTNADNMTIHGNTTNSLTFSVFLKHVFKSYHTGSGSAAYSDILVLNGSGNAPLSEFTGDVQITDTTASSTTEGGYLRLASDDGAVMASGHRLGVIEFAGAVDTSHTITSGAKIQAMTDATWGGSEHGTVLDFYTSDGSTALGSGNPMMRIDAAGNVAMGTDNASGKLTTVSGNNASGTIAVLSGNASQYSKIFIGTNVGKASIAVSGSSDAFFTGTAQDDLIIRQDSASKKIHLGVGTSNTGQLVIDTNSRISLSNNDNNTSNTIFGKSAFNQGGNVGADFNSFFGEGVAGTGTLSTATGNVGMGWVVLQDLTSGSNNVVLGAAAGHEINSGNENIIIGSSSGESLVGVQEGHVAIGSNALGRMATANEVNHLTNDVKLANVALGYYALSSLSGGGDSNIAIGTYAYGGKTSGDVRGSDNVIIGTRAGKNLTDSDQNIVIGKDAFSTASTTSKVVAIGHEALKSVNATGANETVAIGHSALTALTLGAGNTAVGFEALKTITTSDNNTVLGYQALSGSTGISEKNTAIGSGSMVGAINGAAHNTAVGYNTLAAVTSGDNNIAIGNNAGAALTTPSENIFIGKNAGTAVQTDAKVVAIGYNAYMTNDTTNGHDSTATNGSGNTAIGYKSMTGFNDVNCLRNTAIGFDTMSQGTSHNPQDNVAVGYKTLRSINDGDRNTAIGSNALLDIVTGSGSTAVGHDALENTTASECVGVGKGAGQTNTSGINNTFVGTDADSSGNFNYQTAVGWGATTEGSNQTVIGVGSIWKMFSAEVTCDLGGTDENDPAHATPIGKIPHNACVVKAAVVMKTKNGTSGKNDHSLKLVLSSSSSGTDNTVLADVQELVGAGVTHSWNGAAATSQAADIDCSNNTGQNGTAYVSMALPNSRGSDDPTSQLASLDMRDGDRFIYLAFANGSHTDGDTNPASAPVCQVYVEYVGLQL